MNHESLHDDDDDNDDDDDDDDIDDTTLPFVVKQHNTTHTHNLRTSSLLRDARAALCFYRRPVCVCVCVRVRVCRKRVGQETVHDDAQTEAD